MMSNSVTFSFDIPTILISKEKVLYSSTCHRGHKYHVTHMIVKVSRQAIFELMTFCYITQIFYYDLMEIICLRA